MDMYNVKYALIGVKLGENGGKYTQGLSERYEHKEFWLDKLIRDYNKHKENSKYDEIKIKRVFEGEDYVSVEHLQEELDKILYEKKQEQKREEEAKRQKRLEMYLELKKEFG